MNGVVMTQETFTEPRDKEVSYRTPNPIDERFLRFV